jgi:hypothetical protein
MVEYAFKTVCKYEEYEVDANEPGKLSFYALDRTC